MNPPPNGKKPESRENAESRAPHQSEAPLQAGDLEATDERAAQARHSLREVEAERDRLRRMLDQMPVSLLLLTPDYRVPFASRFFQARFGASDGRRCYEYLFHRTEPCLDCQSFEVLKTNAPHRWEWTGPDGHLYDIHDFPFTDADGSPLVLEVGLDITERRKVEAELARYRAHLEDLVQERTRQLAETNARLEAEITARTRAVEELRLGNEELQRFNRAMVGRELRMVELKREVNALRGQAGLSPRYAEVEKEGL